MSERHLTRSAAAERKRIRKVFEDAVTETTWQILASGLPGLTAHQRAKHRSVIKGFEHATMCLRRALDDTGPATQPLDSRTKPHD